MEGAKGPIEGTGIAPRAEHPTRETVVEAIRWVGPLSAPDLRAILDDPEFHLAHLRYHVTGLADEEVLIEVGRRPAGSSIEIVYGFAWSR